MKGSRKMTNIIDELLLLAEIRKVDVKPVPLNMTMVVNDARARLSNLIDAQQALVIVPPSWPPVLGYAPWIEEVWVNYLSNALKYGTQPVEMELGATPLRDGSVRLWVRNKGPELSKKVRSELFKPFVRLKQVEAQGHGLGLSIVRRIVEKLCGEVGVDNEPGYGPIFSFTLPQPEVVKENSPAAGNIDQHGDDRSWQAQ
jgi:signal transduction histidine kinase